MQINMKDFKNWSEADLSEILDNDVYKENEFIDYKETFAIFECEDKGQKKKKQDEFRHDVCSFANADGGYLIYGVKEDAGVPTVIVGVNIDNVDRFELDRRNELSGILPVVPNIDFSFVCLKNGKYVVVLYIVRGNHKPYIHIENEGIFKFFIRRGNRKQAMSYMEISNNFLNTNVLSAEIKKFRNERMMSYLEDKNNSPLALIQVIPDTFINSSAQIELFDLFLENKLNLNSIFYGLCYGHAVPNVDGVYFPSYDYDNHILLQLYNNGSTELLYDIETRDKQGETWVWYPGITDQMKSLVEGTARLYKTLDRRCTMYVCVTIIGCKNMWSEYEFKNDYAAKVDRNEIFCMPLEIKDILDKENVNEVIEECRKAIMYSLGRRR